MTDEAPTIPRATVCPVEDCAVMYPDTIEHKARHRRGHEHRDKVDEAIRRALRRLSGRMDDVIVGNRETVAAMRDDIAGIERLVQGIEVPEQLPQLEIAFPTGWDDDEDDEPDPVAETIDDDWDALTAPAVPETGPEPAPAATESDELAELAPEAAEMIPSPQTPSWRR